MTPVMRLLNQSQFFFASMSVNAEPEKWFFSIIDIVALLTESIVATAYWRKLKQRLKADGKMRMTDVADQEQMFRLIQSIPSPKAEQKCS